MIPNLLLFLISGLCIGSFLNVIIYRLPKNQPISGRSYCDNCKKNLLWYDLIPIISFLLLKGKCRFCKKKIDPLTPIVELLTGILFALVFLRFSTLNIFQLSYYLFLVSSLAVIFFIDLKSGIIPDKIVFPALLISFIFLIFNQNPINNILSAAFTFIFFLMLNVLTKGKGMGFGDVKLSLLLGLVLGFPMIIVSLYLAFLTGALISLILILWRKKHFKKDTIAFGPFLSFGGVVTIFLGDLLVSRLLSFLQ